MDKSRVTIEVKGRKLHLVIYESLSHWLRLYEAEDLWDFLLEEILDGSVEFGEDIWYWYIDGRCYETSEQVED